MWNRKRLYCRFCGVSILTNCLVVRAYGHFVVGPGTSHTISYGSLGPRALWRYSSCMYQIYLGPMNPELVVRIAQGSGYHKRTIRSNNAAVCWNRGAQTWSYARLRFANIGEHEQYAPNSLFIHGTINRCTITRSISLRVPENNHCTNNHVPFTCACWRPWWLIWWLLSCCPIFKWIMDSGNFHCSKQKYLYMYNQSLNFTGLRVEMITGCMVSIHCVNPHTHTHALTRTQTHIAIYIYVINITYICA